MPLYLPKPSAPREFSCCTADIGYYGTCYGKRLEAAALVSEVARERKLTFKNALFLSAYQFCKGILKRPSRFQLMRSYTCRTPIPAHEILNRSRVIFDICEPEQNGASFRLLEAISYQRKIITNNLELRNIIGENDGVVYFRGLDDLPDVLLNIPEDFFSTPPSFPPLDNLRLDRWVEELIP